MPDRWYETPLDFVWKRNSFRLDTHWQYYSYLSHLWYLPLFTRLPNSPNSAWERIPSDIWHRPQPFLIPAGLIVQVPFCLSFLIAWKFHFSTWAEMILWRVSAVYHAAFSLLITVHYIWGWGLGEQENSSQSSTTPSELNQHTDATAFGETQRSIVEISKTMAVLPADVMKGISTPSYHDEQDLAARKNSLKNRVLQGLQSWRNLSPELDPDHEVSLRWAVVQFILTVFYALCHLYIYLEDVISLRSQPADVYLADNQILPSIH